MKARQASRSRRCFRHSWLSGFQKAHRRWFGRDGALLLSVSLYDDGWRSVIDGGWRWLSPSGIDAAAVIDAVARYAFAEEFRTCLVAMTGRSGDAFDRPAPDWLAAAARRIRRDPVAPSVEDLATDCGVHRVHLSRTFVRVHGTSIRDFRQRCMLARTLPGIAFGRAPLSAIAHDAGFSDESHLVRSMRRHVGLPTGAVRRKLQSAAIAWPPR